MATEPWPVCVTDGQALVWSPEGPSAPLPFHCLPRSQPPVVSPYHRPAARALRTLHRVTGDEAGSLPAMAHQNTFLGLPLRLLPEEACLLRERGAVAFFAADGPCPASAASAARLARRTARVDQAQVQAPLP